MNVLIIEDDRPIAGLVSKTLSSYGYHCENAYDGEEAENMLSHPGWDIILLDLMRPKVSGYDLLEYITGLKIPVIIMSAMGQVSDRIRGLRMGADDYLSKHFQVGELIDREVPLVTKEFELLNILIVNKNVALSREQLYESVWKEDYMGETRTLDNHIKRIRQKLGYEDVIQTIFRIGYRMDVKEEGK